MFHGGAYLSRASSGEDENKSRTHDSQIAPLAEAVNAVGFEAGADALNRCSFVAAEHWRYGSDEPFCNAPAAVGSAYCAHHLASCAAEISQTEAWGTEDVPPPPPELAYLAEAALPELIPDDPRELRALVDIDPPDHRGEE
jgi:hypothetical protein